MVTTLVTGATGFVGSWIARELVNTGHTVRVLRRATSRLDAVQDLPLEQFIGDLTDAEILKTALEGVTWVFHVAAISAYWRNDKSSIFRINVDGTRLLLQASESAGVERFIFTSSATTMGFRRDGQPVDEGHYFNINPHLSPYGLSKVLAEAEVYRAIERGLDAVILNPAVVIGPGDLNKISGSLILEAAKGRQPFMPMQGGVTYVDVRDVAKTHVAAAKKGRQGERYLVGAVHMAHRAFFKLVAEIAGVRAPIIPAPAFLVDAAALAADVAKTVGISLPGDAEGNQLRLSKYPIYFNCEKSWRELHTPEIDIRQSIADTLVWYKTHGDL